MRRFFEAIRLDELLHSLRDINASAAQRARGGQQSSHLEHQRDIAAKMQKNLERITAIQRIVHAIEYLVVTYYGVMLWGHIVPEHAEGPDFADSGGAVDWLCGADQPFGGAALGGMGVFSPIGAEVLSPTLADVPFAAQTAGAIEACGGAGYLSFVSGFSSNSTGGPSKARARSASLRR